MGKDGEEKSTKSKLLPDPVRNSRQFCWELYFNHCILCFGCFFVQEEIIVSIRREHINVL